jgi:hypothetical protein
VCCFDSTDGPHTTASSVATRTSDDCQEPTQQQRISGLTNCSKFLLNKLCGNAFISAKYVVRHELGPNYKYVLPYSHFRSIASNIAFVRSRFCWKSDVVQSFAIWWHLPLDNVLCNENSLVIFLSLPYCKKKLRRFQTVWRGMVVRERRSRTKSVFICRLRFNRMDRQPCRLLNISDSFRLLRYCNKLLLWWYRHRPLTSITTLSSQKLCKNCSWTRTKKGEVSYARDN